VAPGARRAAAAAAALRQGYEMALARLDEGLLEQGIREIAAAGAAFDPQRMRAAEAVVSTTAVDGTVLEVLRSGYESDSDVVRVAEVRVARRR
jgi:molecular chaperone GrpE (heat shock protein)